MGRWGCPFYGFAGGVGAGTFTVCVFPECFKDGVLRRTKVVAFGRFVPPLAQRWGYEKRGRLLDQGLTVAQSPLRTYLRFILQQGTRDN